jgi:hypothetical protein
MVIDGPFAETKEQLLGVTTIDGETEAEALAAACEIRRAGTGSLEVRSLRRSKSPTRSS